MAAVCASGVLAAGRPFALYQSIIDRQPFGEGPDDPSVPPENAPRDVRGADGAKTGEELTVEQQQLERAVALYAINISPDGTVMAGFSDTSDPKAPRHYYIAKGQEKGGWILKDADPVEKKVVLSKDGIEIERALGAAPAGGGKNASGALAARRGFGLRNRPSASGAAAETPQSAERSGGMRSHRALKRERDEAERRARQEMLDAQRKRQEEEDVRREEERAQREAENEATRQNLQNMAEELRRMREENRRQKEAAERAAEAAAAQTNDNP